MLEVAHQVVLGLQHLHSLGIIHRDGRASNVLLASLDPVMALLADLGVSHRLSAFVGDVAPVEALSKMGTFLEGEEAKGPYLWSAPEVIAGTRDCKVATFATDVYIFGGLLYEMLTGGTWPFHWQVTKPTFGLLQQRRQSAEPVPLSAPDGTEHLWPGLLNKSVLEAAELDCKPIPWRVNTDGSPGSPGRLEEVKAVMAQCLSADPGARPKFPALGRRLAVLMAAETAETQSVQRAPPLLPKVHLCGVLVNSLEVEDALVAMGVADATVTAVCSIIMSTYYDRLDAAQLPGVLVATGVPAEAALRIHMDIRRVRRQGPAVPGIAPSVYHRGGGYFIQYLLLALCLSAERFFAGVVS